MTDDPKHYVPDLRDLTAFELSRGVAANGEPLLDAWDAAEYATEEYLGKDQVVAIMQGLEPPRWHRRGRTKHLDEYWFEVQRLLDDVRHRRMPMPCRPRELVHWATSRGIALPEAFVKHVPDPNSARSHWPVGSNLQQEAQMRPSGDAKPRQLERTPPPPKLSPDQQSRRDCQVIAIRIWTEKPRISKEKMLMEREIVPYTKGYAVDTVKKWLAPVDPRPPESKPGPRRKRTRPG